MSTRPCACGRRSSSTRPRCSTRTSSSSTRSRWAAGEVLETLAMLRSAAPPGAGPARCDGRAAPAGARVATQERAAGIARPVRRDLDLRPAPDLRALAGIALPVGVKKKITYTGYLSREVSTAALRRACPEITKKPYILVTTGGGGDGEPDRLGAEGLRARSHAAVSGAAGARAFHATGEAGRVHEPGGQSSSAWTPSPSTATSKPWWPAAGVVAMGATTPSARCCRWTSGP